MPKDLDLSSVITDIESIEEVQDLHHAHAWALTTGKNIVSMHVLVDDLVVQEDLLEKIYRILKDTYNVYFSTIQIETKCLEGDEASDIEIH